ncbi:hypothetical protein V5O48_010759 [Marasmius crinis-equi]|uniref:Uncharacterized protein n=1 Tax=Marasmius crinis-equi TaxID=585013 RepID=A0ABR3F7X8_9AGAR
MSIRDSDTELALVLTPKISGAGPVPVGIAITPQLHAEYPSLPGKIVDEIRTSGNNVEITDMDYLSVHPFKAVFWEGHEGRAGILWLDAVELRAHYNRQTLTPFLLSYQQALQLSVYSDTYIIIYDAGHLPDADQMQLQRVQSTIKNTLHIDVFRVENLNDAARAILDISSELFEAINHPGNYAKEERNEYARMLLRIPRMNISRTELVMSECPTVMSLYHFLQSVEAEFHAGLNLNSTIVCVDRTATDRTIVLMESSQESENPLSVTCSDAELTETATEPDHSTLKETDIYDPPGSYLRKVITKDYYDRQRRLKIIPRSPPETPIECSFNAFTEALGPALICAQWTPSSRTAPGSAEEFKQFEDRLGATVDLVIPESSGTPQGNLLEAKRMLLTSAVKWIDHWGQSLPDGVEKFWLFQNMLREISRHARMRAHDDNMLILGGKKNEVFRYREHNWRDVSEVQLKKVAWRCIV